MSRSPGGGPHPGRQPAHRPDHPTATDPRTHHTPVVALAPTADHRSRDRRGRARRGPDRDPDRRTGPAGPRKCARRAHDSATAARHLPEPRNHPHHLPEYRHRRRRVRPPLRLDPHRADEAWPMPPAPSGGRGCPASITGERVTRHHRRLAEGRRSRGLSRTGRSLAPWTGGTSSSPTSSPAWARSWVSTC
jgi:hypothetical protein